MYFQQDDEDKSSILYILFPERCWWKRFDFQLICGYFSSTDRQGPGSEACTLKAFSYLKDLPNHPKIADLGCGTGSSSLVLAKHTEAHITAIDLFPLFIEKLNTHAQQDHVNEKIHAIVGDIGELPFEEASFDVKNDTNRPP